MIGWAMKWSGIVSAVRCRGGEPTGSGERGPLAPWFWRPVETNFPGGSSRAELLPGMARQGSPRGRDARANARDERAPRSSRAAHFHNAATVTCAVMAAMDWEKSWVSLPRVSAWTENAVALRAVSASVSPPAWAGTIPATMASPAPAVLRTSTSGAREERFMRGGETRAVPAHRHDDLLDPAGDQLARRGDDRPFARNRFSEKFTDFVGVWLEEVRFRFERQT